MSDASRNPCDIRDVGKARRGTTRFWCKSHGANATGRYGMRLAQCERAHLDVDPGRIIGLDLSSYPGGIALWASVDPVIDTTGFPPERGVHIHARLEPGGKKVIDETVPAVSVAYKRDLIENGRALITHETAVSYYLSRFLGREVTCLFCTYCGAPHLDAEYFAIKPHRKHLCHTCGHFFHVDSRTISNPLVLARHELGMANLQGAPIPATHALDLVQADHPGGIQVWASNPAILWTAARPEEEGIHVHAYGPDGTRTIDDTFARVTIDGVELPPQEVAYLMAQQTLSFLHGKIAALKCPSCGEETLETGNDAFWPHADHQCAGCGEVFQASGRRRLVVSNPLVRKIRELATQQIQRGIGEGLHLHHGHGH